MNFSTTAFLFSAAILRLQATSYPIPADTEWGQAMQQAQSRFLQHQTAEAEDSARRALRIAKRPGNSDDRVAITYYLLGNIYRESGNCAASRTNYSRSIAAWEKQPSTRPQYVFSSIIGLLDVLCECEQFGAAEKTFRVYESRLQRYQTSQREEADLLSLRGTIASARKNYRQAELNYRRAIQMLEQSPAGAVLQIEEIRLNLAMVIGKQGRHAEALAESQHVIDFLDRSGVSRPSTLAGSLNNAACSLADLGRMEEAERTFQRALATAAKQFGEDSVFTARIMLNYARVLREDKQSLASAAMQKKGAEALRLALVRDSATVDIQDLK